MSSVKLYNICFSGSRNVRRKSVLSPRMLRPPGDDIENSPANSITSVNSIASLLREKLQVNKSLTTSSHCNGILKQEFRIKDKLIVAGKF